MFLPDLFYLIEEGDKLKLYSTDCPNCKILEKKLNMKNIKFELIKNFDVSYLTNKGFYTAPILELDNGECLDFIHANTYINNM